MTPFSARYYIRNNIKRCISLILLLALSATAYLGYMYVHTFSTEGFLCTDYMKDVAFVTPRENIDTKEKLNKYFSDVEKVEKCSSVSKVYPINFVNIEINTTMNISASVTYPIFENFDDAKSYNDTVKLMNESDLPKAGEIAMSSKLAKNLGLKSGDVVSKDNENFGFIADGKYKVKVFESENMTALAVNADSQLDNHSAIYMAIRNPGEREQTCEPFENELNSLEAENPTITLQTYSDIMYNGELGEFMQMLNMMYYAILLFVCLILIFTINAIFTGAYERRRYEFSVYKALGLSKRERNAKIIKEILLMDVIGVITGMAIVLLSMFILDTTYLNPRGLSLGGFSLEGFLIMLACNICIVAPIILLKIRKMKKYDITEF